MIVRLDQTCKRLHGIFSTSAGSIRMSFADVVRVLASKFLNWRRVRVLTY